MYIFLKGANGLIRLRPFASFDGSAWLWPQHLNDEIMVLATKELNMSGTILGMHVQRGQLDAVETFFTEADIAEGVAVKLTAADTVAAVSAASDHVIGIAGGKRTGVGVAVVRHGKIWAELAADETPVVGAPAYVNASGKLVASSSDAILVGYFTSAEVRTNGIHNVPSYADNVRCAQVFVDL